MSRSRFKSIFLKRCGRSAIGGLAVLLTLSAAQVKADSLLEWTKKFIDRATAPESTPAPDTTTSAHMQGAPLPSSPNAPSEKDFRKLYTAWLNRTIMAHFPADKDPAGAAFLRAALDYLGSDPVSFGPSPELVAQERALDLSTVNDPGLLFAIGLIEPATQRQRDAFGKALPLCPGSAYPKFIWFTVAANLGKVDKISHASPEELKTDDALSFKYLAEGLSDDSFLPTEMSALRWRFHSGSFKDLYSRNGQEVVDIFEASAKVDPWVKNYVEGVHFVDAAWEARGADWANKVKPEGWKGFEENLALARDHLVNSWKQNPHDPAAAGEMITVCMGESEETDTMRKWFDHAVAADFDFMEAYYNLKWGLRPRWLGTYAEMNAFGQECAATGRYDTWVPDERVAIALDISDDAEDHGAQFQNSETASQVLAVLNKYLAQPKPVVSVPFLHTLAAIVAHKAGRIDEMKKHLTAIAYKPDMNDRLKRLDDLPALVTQAQAAASP